MAYIPRDYSEKAIDLLFKIIEQNNKYYDVEIDGNEIIGRTSDTDRFYDFMEFIQPTTKYVAIRVYKGGSPNNDRNVFTMPQNGLNGIPKEEAHNAFDKKPKIDIAKERADWEKDRLIEDLKKAKESLEAENARIKEEAKEQIREIEADAKEQIQAIKDRQSSLSGVLETVAPALAQTLSKSKLAETYPMLGALGTIEEQNETTPSSTEEPSGVKFTPKSDAPSDDKLLALVADLRKHFEDEELEIVFNFLHHASQNKSLLIQLENLIPTQHADL
ncbi:hypothetical protein WAF17_10820 [Bernardetia sp. ABR2-2B]|uniref:hypothetical protein n=1 Tax=Bernardetia sp. ABR2-2B TaxID=3127472 RepID=UPI0030CDA1E5